MKKHKGLQKSIFLTLKDLKNDRKQSNNSDPKMYTDLNLNIMGNMCQTHICSKNNLIFKNFKQFLTYAFSACLNWDQIPGIPRRQKWYLRQTSVRKVRFCLTRKYSWKFRTDGAILQYFLDLHTFGTDWVIFWCIL